MCTRRRVLGIGVLLIPSLFTACGDGDSTGPGGSPMTARVDGQQWTAVELSVVATPGQSGTFTISGTESANNTSRSINLALYNIRGTGTYAFGVSTEVVGGRAQYSEAGVVWATPASGAAGTVTLTTLTPTRIVGTFAYNAQLSSGSSSTQMRAITNGVFDIPMQTASGSLPVVPDNAGSIVTATLRGDAYNAATAFATTSIQGNGLGFNTHALIYRLDMSLAGVTTAGTYSVSQPSGRTISAGLYGQANSGWGLTAQDVGTVTITSVTATRLRGTFSATLQPGSNSTQTQSLVITNGTFDVGR